MSFQINKAKDRLALTEDALKELKCSTDYSSFKKSWTNFLLHSHGVFTQLEQACKISPQATQWYASKRNLRKHDPLMQYLHHARNSNEHSIEETTDYDAGGLGIGVQKEGFAQELMLNTQPDGSLRIDSTDGKPVLVEVIEPHYRLRAVTDRGVKYAVPKSHLGSVLDSTEPLYIAELGYSFIKALIDDAEATFS